jgi:hypothetical protein
MNWPICAWTSGRLEAVEPQHLGTNGLSPRKISDIHQMDAIIYNAGISILSTPRSLTDKAGSHMRSNFN